MGIKMTRIAGLAAGLVLMVGMAACDNKDDSANDPAGDSESSSSQSASDPDSSSGSSDDSAGDEEGDGTEALTLSGTISAGTEAGCVLLEQDGTTYNLIGGDKDVLAEGADVEVTGKVSEDAMTTCQEGTPFQVDSATAK